MNTMWTVAGALVLVGTANAQLSIESLSSLGGTGSIAWDINDNGQVCGESLTAGDQFIRATLWQSNGSVSDLGGANGAVNSVAYAINSLGATVGYSEFASGLRTATLWNNTPRGVFNPVVDLGAAMNAQGSSVAWDINDFGAVAGQASLGPGFAKGFLWDDANGGRIAGWSSMYQGGANRGINNSGVLVGSAFFFGDPDDAFLSRPDDRGGYEDSDIQPEGYNLSMATDISNTDICVGFTSHGVDDGWQAAIFLGRGEVQLLGTLAELESSEANAVNDAGMIVGYAWDSRDFELNPSAWAWVGGTMYDLNDFIEGTGFVHLLQATGVNNHGDIVGFGLLEDGTTSGFVIRGFVPAPGSVLALVAGLGMAGRRRR